MIVYITDNLGRLIDEINGRLTVISYRLGFVSRKRQYIFVLFGLFVMVRDFDTFSKPMRERHFRSPNKALRLKNFALGW
jgi:hypothetical protein